eukprot:GDKH01003719.1.p1 GENE.GDKH01003719.1~~GDKH01003719.1.p1  ORF type:complete len:113 (+),score=9.34 GDKH01003719.1:155-493(+)
MSGQAPGKGRDRFFQSQEQVQQQLRSQGDEQLQELGRTADRLHNAALVVSNEIQEQQRMLSELDQEIDREAAKMNFVMGKMAKLLKTSDSKQICLVLFLIAVLAVLLVMIFY